MRSLAERLSAGATVEQYAGYAYAYPHKTSYRPIQPAVRLRDAWKDEAKDSLFLYVHLPFCEMRCGFCNLFTTVQPDSNFVTETLAAIERQSHVVASEVVPQKITQVAIGGGTPSFLTTSELEQLFDSLNAHWPVDWQHVPFSFEVSPSTLDVEKLAMLRDRGVDRISMGVQSFSDSDLKGLGRPQKQQDVDLAVEMIGQQDFPLFNLDLIYGSSGQTMQGWKTTISRTIDIGPEEIYLYPLYVRDLTGLHQVGQEPSHDRRSLYRFARQELLAAGYQQRSMRLFRRRDITRETEHCCQKDGMIGLGPGARSYTRGLHYSSEYAVGQTGVRRIIADFNARSEDSFSHANYGVTLNDEEQRRRFVIKSLLQTDGLLFGPYFQRFGSVAMEDVPELMELADLDLARQTEHQLRLTDEGLGLSDVIGPWLYSKDVVARMEACELV